MLASQVMLECLETAKQPYAPRVCCQIKSVKEIDAVVELTSAAFAEEVRGTGLTPVQWQGLEKDHLIDNPALWRHVGMHT